jgi:hypothetical protein
VFAVDEAAAPANATAVAPVEVVMVVPGATGLDQVPPSADIAADVAVNQYKDKVPPKLTVAVCAVAVVVSFTASPTLRATAVAKLSVTAIAEAAFVKATLSVVGSPAATVAFVFEMPTGATAFALGLEIATAVPITRVAETKLANFLIPDFKTILFLVIIKLLFICSLLRPKRIIGHFGAFSSFSFNNSCLEYSENAYF